MSRRVIVIILDSLGMGALPDAADYGDVGAATLPNLARVCKDLSLPTLQSLGIGNIVPLEGLDPVDEPLAIVGRLSTSSKGKDTITGHWELMGVVSEQAFPLYPEGFPPELMDAFTKLTGYGWLGNYPASGTEIIRQLGPEHMLTGNPIIYTSGDSVFQVAAHMDIIPLEELYRICQVTRSEILVGKHACARVIARPFIGSEEAGFTRTADRHDYALSPPVPTALDCLHQAGIQTLCIGKISDIFNGNGVSVSWPTKSNTEGMQMLVRALLETAGNDKGSFIFANLVDFDMLWGHRRDSQGYAHGLEEFDQWLATFLPKLAREDLLIITADHGCDPTFLGTDHTREYVPLIVYSPDNNGSVDSWSSVQIHSDRGTHDLTKVATIVEDYLLQKNV
ncbi:MAG: phosphopentomutase [Coriobacteriia bacterium]|nr:phosphopentomutase [Coriobacteriia bacterium]MCL2870257.1 phosphopentomutase [Coriobacteriia bacterium]